MSTILRALCKQTPATTRQAEQDTLVAVTKMMLVLAVDDTERAQRGSARRSVHGRRWTTFRHGLCRPRSGAGIAATAARTSKASPTTITGARPRPSFAASPGPRCTAIRSRADTLE